MRQLLRRTIGRLRADEGANLVEAAIITPLLLLMTFSTVEFATLFYVHLALESGVGQATRFVVTGRGMDDPDNPGGTLNRQQSIIAATRKAAPSLTIPDNAFTFSHMSPGAAVWQGGVGGPGDIERVTVNYNWTVLTPAGRIFFPGGQITLRSESMMKNESRFE